jgi:hypothetical protein
MLCANCRERIETHVENFYKTTSYEYDGVLTLYFHESCLERYHSSDALVNIIFVSGEYRTMK